MDNSEFFDNPVELPVLNVDIHCIVAPDEEQREKIEKTAKAILDARELYPDSSFADMYGEHMYLFPALLTAHQNNDRAVMAAYGFPIKGLAIFVFVVDKRTDVLYDISIEHLFFWRQCICQS